MVVLIIVILGKTILILINKASIMNNCTNELTKMKKPYPNVLLQIRA